MLGTEIKALCKYYDRRQLCYNRVRADLLSQDLYWVLVPLPSTSVTLVELFISSNPVSSRGRDSDNASYTFVMTTNKEALKSETSVKKYYPVFL